VALSSIYRHPRLPKMLKQLFNRYTRKHDNATWSFIYTFRNESVHHKSINQLLPLSIDLFTDDDPFVFFTLHESKKELIVFFEQCLRFLENFAVDIFV
jgi:hypothetical protein